MSKEINFFKYEPDPVSQFTIDDVSCSRTIFLVQDTAAKSVNHDLFIEQKSRNLFIDLQLKDKNAFVHDRILNIKSLLAISGRLNQLLSRSPYYLSFK